MLKNSLPKYKIFCLLIVLLNCFVVQGQNKYIKWIEKKNYEKAAEKLPSFIKKSEGDPIDLMNGYFALAYLSNQKDYEKFNVNDAYDYILKAYSNYDIASFENAKKLERDDITLEILNDYLNQICLNAYDYYCAKDNVKDYEYFLNYFQRMENNLKRNIILKRNSKAFMEAKMNDSEEAYNNFIVTYPDALDRSSAIDLRNKKGFEKAQELDKIESYQNFISKYPRAEQVKIAEERIHEIAFEQTKELNTNKDYLKYYNDYPNSKFAEKAFFLHQEREFFENTQQGSWKSYQNFREKYSDNPWRNVALDSIYQISKKSMHPRAMNYLFKEDNRFYILKNLKLYYQWISKDGELSTLEQFRLDFPQSYEQIDLFQYDLEVAKMAHELYLTSSFDNTNVSNTVNDDVTKRLQREGAKSGAVQVSLIWDNYNDLDLYCIDPLGEEISYNNKFSQSGGELDVDMNVNYGESLEPVENIYWSEGKVPTGEYRVYVKHFKNHYCGDNCEDPTFYNVRVKNGRNTKDYFGEIAHYNDRVEVVRFNFKPAKFGDLEINSDNIARYEEYIKKAAPKELAFVALQRLISENLEKKRWKSALRVVNKFKSYFQGDKKIEQLEAMLSKEYDNSIAVVNLKSINTEGNEYYPIISANSQSLYFVGKDRSDNMGLEDIFKSNMINDKWTSAYIQTNLSSRESNEAISSLSADGNIAIYFKDGVLGAFQKTMDGWMEINYLPESINVGKWNGGAMISSDNNTIIFASNRESYYSAPG